MNITKAGLFVASCSMMLLFSNARPAASEELFTARQKAEIEQITRDYLLRNPELLAEVMATLRRKQAAKETEVARTNIRKYRQSLIAAKGDPVGGNVKGSVTVIEFFDYNCPYCRRAKRVVKRLLKNDARVRYVFKEFPILSKGSRVAARSALAVWYLAPEKYMQVHQTLMLTKGQVTEKRLRQVIAQAGLTWEAVESRAKLSDIEAKIQANLALSQKLRISGTPTFVIGDEIFPGLSPYETLKSAIDKTALAQTPAKTR